VEVVHRILAVEVAADEGQLRFLEVEVVAEEVMEHLNLEEVVALSTEVVHLILILGVEVRAEEYIEV